MTNFVKRSTNKFTTTLKKLTSHNDESIDTDSDHEIGSESDTENLQFQPSQSYHPKIRSISPSRARSNQNAHAKPGRKYSTKSPNSVDSGSNADFGRTSKQRHSIDISYSSPPDVYSEGETEPENSSFRKFIHSHSNATRRTPQKPIRTNTDISVATTNTEISNRENSHHESFYSTTSTMPIESTAKNGIGRKTKSPIKSHFPPLPFYSSEPTTVKKQKNRIFSWNRHLPLSSDNDDTINVNDDREVKYRYRRRRIDETETDSTTTESEFEDDSNVHDTSGPETSPSSSYPFSKFSKKKKKSHKKSSKWKPLSGVDYLPVPSSFNVKRAFIGRRVGKRNKSNSKDNEDLHVGREGGNIEADEDEEEEEEMGYMLQVNDKDEVMNQFWVFNQIDEVTFTPKRFVAFKVLDGCLWWANVPERYADLISVVNLHTASTAGKAVNVAMENVGASNSDGARLEEADKPQAAALGNSPSTNQSASPVVSNQETSPTADKLDPSTTTPLPSQPVSPSKSSISGKTSPSEAPSSAFPTSNLPMNPRMNNLSSERPTAESTGAEFLLKILEYELFESLNQIIPLDIGLLAESSSIKRYVTTSHFQLNSRHGVYLFQAKSRTEKRRFLNTLNFLSEAISNPVTKSPERIVEVLEEEKTPLRNSVSMRSLNSFIDVEAESSSNKALASIMRLSARNAKLEAELLTMQATVEAKLEAIDDYVYKFHELDQLEKALHTILQRATTDISDLIHRTTEYERNHEDVNNQLKVLSEKITKRDNSLEEYDNLAIELLNVLKAVKKKKGGLGVEKGSWGKVLLGTFIFIIFSVIINPWNIYGFSQSNSNFRLENKV